MKKIVIANWKMNPQTLREARSIFEKIKRGASSLKRTEAAIAPPSVFISDLSKRKGKVKLGAQDVFYADSGAYTGQISAKMLKNFGVSYVIVGHSEKRELGETDELVHEKLKQALSKGFRAVLCVGEKEKSREAFPPRVRSELKSALSGIPRRFASRILVAYEPIWAISSGRGARADSPQDLFKMSIFIRRVILDIWGKSAALRVPILYGGSVSSKNAKSFIEVGGMGGLLVGSASLKPEEFNSILKEAEKL